MTQLTEKDLIEMGWGEIENANRKELDYKVEVVDIKDNSSLENPIDTCGWM